MAKAGHYQHKGKSLYHSPGRESRATEALVWSYDKGKHRREYHVQVVTLDMQETISHVVFEVQRNA